MNVVGCIVTENSHKIMHKVLEAILDNFHKVGKSEKMVFYHNFPLSEEFSNNRTDVNTGMPKNIAQRFRAGLVSFSQRWKAYKTSSFCFPAVAVKMSEKEMPL